ncbi:vasoactive intestinal polypeptide receptor-like, partial [Clarias magur]
MASDSSDCRILSAPVSDELVNARLYGRETKKNAAYVSEDRNAASTALSHPTALVYFSCKAKESFNNQRFYTETVFPAPKLEERTQKQKGRMTSGAVHMCDVVNEMNLEREQCENRTAANITSGCKGMWDIVACWPSARVGELVVIPCPNYFRYFNEHHNGGNLSKTCTADGWTEVQPLMIAVNCGYNINGTVDDDNFFRSVKIGYTIGHSVSLISLTTAIIILCIFRKLHCTRNYIHIHLFVAFILKAIAVLIKDVVLYDVTQESDNCTSGP